MKKQKNKNEPISSGTVAVAQTGTKKSLGALSSYFTGGNIDYSLYSALREAVPVIDAAIFKLIRLLGSFEVKTDNKRIDNELKDFLKTVCVGPTQRGISSFISVFFEELLTYGTAVGEMVVTDGRISHLYNAPLKNVVLKEGENALDITICADNGFGEFLPVPYPSLVLVGAHNPKPGEIYGNSILKGLPFVSDILLRIFDSIGTNWDRVGNIRYAVTYKPQGDVLDKAYAKERAMQVASQWSKAMDSNGPVKDFVAVGDVEIKAIGADNQILDSEVPVRQMLEQIVAKLGIPPFLLGLSWSSTERMSYQQADILTSEIDAYRREIEPVILKICSLWFALHGYDAKAEIVWDNITLQDITELSRSRYYDAQTERIYHEIGEVKADEF